MACMHKGNRRNTGNPTGRRSSVLGKPGTREGWPGPGGVAERVVVVMKLGNAGGAKDPWSETSAGRGERGGDWQ